MRRNKTRFIPLVLFPLLLFSLFTLLSPSASAQVLGDGESFYGVEMELDQGAVYVEYMRQERINVTLHDVSMSVQDETFTPVTHRIEIDTEIHGDSNGGWYVNVPFNSLPSRSGDTHTLPILVETTALIEDPVVEIDIQATYVPRGGDGGSVTNATILAVAQPNPRLSLLSQSTPDRFSPDEQRQVPMLVQNEDYYPNMISFSAQASEGWVVSPPSSVQLGPKESTVVHFFVKAPQEPWFRVNPSSDSVRIEAEIVDGGMVASQSVQTPVSGWFLPGWVIPHLTLLLMGAAVLTKRGVEKTRENRLRKGAPSFPGLPPEKAARYEALKAAAPEKAERMKERLKKVHKERKQTWKEAYKEDRKQASDRRRNVNSRRKALLKQRKEQAKQEKQEKKRLEERKARRKELLEKKRELAEEAQREEGRREDELTDRMRDQRGDQDA